MLLLAASRREVLVAGLTLLAAAGAQAAPADPAKFVASIYANGKVDATWTQWLDGAKRGAWFSREVSALWAKCDALAKTSDDKLGPLDFDVATNSQGMEVKKFAVKVLSQDATRATVVATLTPDQWTRASKRENIIRYDLVAEAGRWAIDDIHGVIEPNPWSLRDLLTAYLKS